jgi:hypothetical protein
VARKPSFFILISLLYFTIVAVMTVAAMMIFRLL